MARSKDDSLDDRFAEPFIDNLPVLVYLEDP
jgi:hypothetical protein